MPVVFVVLLISGVMLVFGAILLGDAKRDRNKLPRDSSRCQECSFKNPRNARFCARCGQKLNTEQ